MYRIQLAPGEETVFRTIEELAVGVRNGLVTPRARIYHNASQKWLPIEFHPHYKQACAMPSARVSGEPTVQPGEGAKLNPPSVAAAAGRHDTAVHPHVEEADEADETSEADEAEPRDRAAAPRTPVEPSPFKTGPTRPPWSFGLEPETPEYAEEPRVVPAPPAPPPAPALPAPVASPVFELPKITYPEITPVEDPVAETAGGAARARGPLQVAGAFLVLAAGAYFAVAFFSPAHRAPRAPVPAAAVERPTVQDEVEPTIDQTDDRPAAPASSGFAAALDARAIAKGPAPKLPGGRTAPAAVTSPAASLALPTTSRADSAGSIAPAPVELDLDVAGMPVGESLVASPRTKGDSAMKRILRAVSGGKDDARP